MNHRSLGETGMRVSEISLLNTADVYGDGRSEIRDESSGPCTTRWPLKPEA